MLITITVVSILGISAVVWLANKLMPFVVCPICAGVFLTWTGLLSASFAGYQIDLVVPALLMGGSVVGITYQLEKRFRDQSAGRLLLWKVLVMPTGFVAAYAVLEEWWVVLLIAVATLFSLILVFSSSDSVKGLRSAVAGDLERKMKNCC